MITNDTTRSSSSPWKVISFGNFLVELHFAFKLGNGRKIKA